MPKGFFNGQNWPIILVIDTEDYIFRGKVLAGYRKKLLSLYATAYITIDMNGKFVPLLITSPATFT